MVKEWCFGGCMSMNVAAGYYVAMNGVVSALVIEYFLVRERRSGNRILMAEFPWRSGGFRWSCGKLMAENQ